MGIVFNPVTGSLDFVKEYLKKVGTVLSPLSDGDSLTLNINGIAATPTDGLVLSNGTAATVGVTSQLGPRIRWVTSGWDSDGSVAVSQFWTVEPTPISGTTVTSILKFGVSSDNVTYTYPMTIRSDGMLAILGDIYIRSAGYLYGSVTTEGYLRLGSSAMGLEISRNTSDAFSTLTIDNVSATNTGNILDLKSQSVIRATIDNNGVYNVKRDGIATTSSDGIILSNNTASTAGVPVQQAPRANFLSQVWNGSANELSNWILETVPTSGATPTSALKFGYSRNGGAYSYKLHLTSDGNIQMTNGASLVNMSSVHYGYITIGNSARGFIVNRNVNDASDAITINNQQGTGNIANFQFADATKAYIDKDGMGYFSSIGLTGIRIPTGFFTDLYSNSISTDAQYFGDSSTDGSWKMEIESGDLVIYKRETGTWIEKGRYE